VTAMRDAGDAALRRPVDRAVRRAGTPPIAVAVVNFNTRDHLEACLASVSAAAPEVVVVDNASSDGSAEMVRSNFPEVALIENADNRGYGAGANQAIRASAQPYVLLINSDTRVRADALAALARHLDRHPKAAIVGPRLLDLDGTPQVSAFPFPTPLQSFLQMTFFGTLIRRVARLHYPYWPAFPPDTPGLPPWLLGAALAVRRAAFDAVGGFDEGFFMYSEEVDLCYRLRAAGWEVQFTPLAEVVHVGGASTTQNRVAMEVQRYAATRQFYRKHYSRAARRTLTALTTYRMLHNLARDSALRRLERRPSQRRELTEQMWVWRRILRGAWRE
jgi:N-acetylglucosaminyl-diphospho-decaprenol L-rhamnosyltransferase